MGHWIQTLELSCYYHRTVAGLLFEVDSSCYRAFASE